MPYRPQLTSRPQSAIGRWSDRPDGTTGSLGAGTGAGVDFGAGAVLFDTFFAGAGAAVVVVVEGGGAAVVVVVVVGAGGGGGGATVVVVVGGAVVVVVVGAGMFLRMKTTVTQIVPSFSTTPTPA